MNLKQIEARSVVAGMKLLVGDTFELVTAVNTDIKTWFSLNGYGMEVCQPDTLVWVKES